MSIVVPPSRRVLLQLQWAFLVLMAHQCGADIGADGLLSLLVATQLTEGNVKMPDPGWVQLASALMAIEHFNARDPSVVPELSDYQNCPIQFDRPKVMDTGGEHLTMRKMMAASRGNPLQALRFDAIAGPYNELPSLELSVLATTLEIPIVATGNVDIELLNPGRHPYFSQVSADSSSVAKFLVQYLLHVERKNFVAIVYERSARAMQKVDILRVLFDFYGIDQVRTFSYMSKSASFGHFKGDGLPESSVRYALERVLKTGFRTIVWISDDMRYDCWDMHQAASDFGLDQGEHLWVILGGVSQLSWSEQVQQLKHMNETFGPTNFLRGAAFLNPHDAFAIDGSEQFRKSFFRQDEAFVQRLVDLTPIDNYYDWTGLNSTNNTQRVTLRTILKDLKSWWVGSGYLYDAIMSIGLGACEAARMGLNNSAAITGYMHLRGIRSVNFTGATGRVAFHNLILGSRQGDTIPFAVVNLLPARESGNETLLELTGILDPRTGDFIEIEPFVYADGTTIPPSLLRDTPDQNYLSPGFRAFGLGLMGVDLSIVALSAIWVFAYRKHTVVIAAQPLFLYAVCLGSAVYCSSIYFLSLDEGQGWTREMLDVACMTSAWLGSLGSWIVYGALFTKLWQVNRLMVQKAAKVRIWVVIAPTCIYSAVFLGFMAHWTLTTDYGWERIEVDPVSGASIGQCWGNHNSDPVFWTIILLLQIPVFLTARMAWKTVGIDDLYSEAKFVLIFLLLQIQVTFVGAPVQHILSTTSRDGFFLGTSLIYWSLPASAMGLIIFPKVLTVRKMQQSASDTNEPEQERRRSISQLAGEDIGSPAASASNIRESRGGETEATANMSSLSLSSGPRIQIVTFD